MLGGIFKSSTSHPTIFTVNTIVNNVPVTQNNNTFQFDITDSVSLEGVAITGSNDEVVMAVAQYYYQPNIGNVFYRIDLSVSPSILLNLQTSNLPHSPIILDIAATTLTTCSVLFYDQYNYVLSLYEVDFIASKL